MKRTYLCLGALALSMWVCGCGSSGATSTVTCGAGTHNNGGGTCVIDNAYAILNTSGNYWQCNLNSVGALQFLSGGSGNFLHTTPPGTQTIAWAETAASTDGITFSAGASNYTLSGIAPNAPVGAVSFTANYNTNYPTSCSLVNSAFP